MTPGGVRVGATVIMDDNVGGLHVLERDSPLLSLGLTFVYTAITITEKGQAAGSRSICRAVVRPAKSCPSDWPLPASLSPSGTHAALPCW